MGKVFLSQFNFNNYQSAKQITLLNNYIPSSSDILDELSTENSNNIYLILQPLADNEYSITTNNEDVIYLNSNLSGFCRHLTGLQETDLLNKSIANYHYVSNMHSTFANCYSLAGTPVSAKRVKSMYGTYYNCGALEGSAQVNANVNNLIGAYYNCVNIVHTPSTVENTKVLVDAFYNCINLTGAIIDADMAKSLMNAYYNCYLLEGKPANCNSAFVTINTYYNCPNIYGEFYWYNQAFDQADKINATNMFYGRNFQNSLNIYVKENSSILNALVNYSSTFGNIYGIGAIDWTLNLENEERIIYQNLTYNTNIIITQGPFIKLNRFKVKDCWRAYNRGRYESNTFYLEPFIIINDFYDLPQNITFEQSLNEMYGINIYTKNETIGYAPFSGIINYTYLYLNGYNMNQLVLNETAVFDFSFNTLLYNEFLQCKFNQVHNLALIGLSTDSSEIVFPSDMNNIENFLGPYAFEAMADYRYNLWDIVQHPDPPLHQGTFINDWGFSTSTFPHGIDGFGWVSGLTIYPAGLVIYFNSWKYNSYEQERLINGFNNIGISTQQVFLWNEILTYSNEYITTRDILQTKFLRPICNENYIRIPGLYCRSNLKGAPVCGEKIIDFRSTYELASFDRDYYPVCGSNVISMSSAYKDASQVIGKANIGNNVIYAYGAYTRSGINIPTFTNNLIYADQLYLGCLNIEFLELNEEHFLNFNNLDIPQCFQACNHLINIQYKNLNILPTIFYNVTASMGFQSCCNLIEGFQFGLVSGGRNNFTASRTYRDCSNIVYTNSLMIPINNIYDYVVEYAFDNCKNIQYIGIQKFNNINGTLTLQNVIHSYNLRENNIKIYFNNINYIRCYWLFNNCKSNNTLMNFDCYINNTLMAYIYPAYSSNMFSYINIISRNIKYEQDINVVDYNLFVYKTYEFNNYRSTTQYITGGNNFLYSDINIFAYTIREISISGGDNLVVLSFNEKNAPYNQYSVRNYSFYGTLNNLSSIVCYKNYFGPGGVDYPFYDTSIRYKASMPLIKNGMEFFINPNVENNNHSLHFNVSFGSSYDWSNLEYFLTIKYNQSFGINRTMANATYCYNGPICYKENQLRLTLSPMDLYTATNFIKPINMDSNYQYILRLLISNKIKDNCNIITNMKNSYFNEVTDIFVSSNEYQRIENYNSINYHVSIFNNCQNMSFSDNLNSLVLYVININCLHFSTGGHVNTPIILNIFSRMYSQYGCVDFSNTNITSINTVYLMGMGENQYNLQDFVRNLNEQNINIRQNLVYESCGNAVNNIASVIASNGYNESYPRSLCENILSPLGQYASNLSYIEINRMPGIPYTQAMSLEDFRNNSRIVNYWLQNFFSSTITNKHIHFKYNCSIAHYSNGKYQVREFPGLIEALDGTPNNNSFGNIIWDSKTETSIPPEPGYYHTNTVTWYNQSRNLTISWIKQVPT